MEKKQENILSFIDNSIWKYCYKFFLLKREYFSSTINGLTKSPKIFHITKRDFFNPNCLRRDQ